MFSKTMKMHRVGFFIFLSLASTGIAAGQNAGQFLVRCSDSLVKKNYQDAVAKCTKAIEAQPDSVEAFQLRASAYEKIAYYSAAIGDYTSLIRLTKGAAKFHFYRAELYSKRIENQKAIDDYTAVITKEPTGPFTAKSLYGRGLIYDKVGRKAAAQDDYESAVKLDPGFTEAKKKIDPLLGYMTITQAADNIIPGIPPTLGMNDKGAETKPKPLPTPTPDILKGGTITDATDRILADTFGGGKGEYDGLFYGKTTSSAAAVKVPAEWKRTVLTGTGLSVASPSPFILQRSEPLASLVGNTEADVLWEFKSGGLRAYVGYTKEDKGYKAVRQHLEDTIQLMLNNAKAVESLIHDTTFLGETGAFYDEVIFETPSNMSMRRKILVFGTPTDVRRIDLIFPAEDAAATTLSSQIIASFKKEGRLATGKPKVAETKPKPLPATSPSVAVKTSPTKLLPERQPTPAEDERLDKITYWRDRGVKPTADDIVWASSYIFEQIKYLKNRDKGDKETAEKISGLYHKHGTLRGSLLDFKGEIADLTNCLVYSPKDHWCTVSRVYAYLAVGNKPLALADANKIVELQPEWTLAYEARASVHCAMGNKSLALADERKVIELGGTVTTPCK